MTHAIHELERSVKHKKQVKAYRDAAGPRVLRQLTESVQSGLETGKFPKEAKEANEALIESFKVIQIATRFVTRTYATYACAKYDACSLCSTDHLRALPPPE